MADFICGISGCFLRQHMYRAERRHRTTERRTHRGPARLAARCRAYEGNSPLPDNACQSYTRAHLYSTLLLLQLGQFFICLRAYSSSRAAAQNVASTAACSILKRGATLYVEVLTIPTNAGAFSLLSRPLLPPPTLLRIRLACGCPAALQRCSVLSTLSRVVVVMGRRRLHREQSSIAIAIMGNGKSGNGNPLSLRFFTHVVSL